MDYKNLSWLFGVDRKICPEGHCSASQGLPNSDLEGQIFLSTPNNLESFFFLLILPVFIAFDHF